MRCSSEYVPFIVLLFSLYTISGGIRIEGDLRAHPLTNAVFLLVGGVLASFIGTTGAAMLLIRPLLETNSERKHVVHTVIFFIFIVCNCGGCLLPLGDPPLFLGYLLGVPFLYTLTLWKEWLFVNGLLIAIYYLWDRFWYYPHEEMADIVRDETQVRPSATRRHLAECPFAGRRRAFGGLFGSRQNDPGHRLASVDVLARDRAIGVGGPVAGTGQPRHVRGRQQFQLRRDHRSGGPVLWHLHHHAAGLADPGHSRPEFGLDRTLALFLGHGRAVVGARQRPDLRRVLHHGQVADRQIGTALADCRRFRTTAGGRQPGLGVHGREYLHRQRAEFHGQGHRREVGRENAQLFRLHAV